MIFAPPTGLMFKMIPHLSNFQKLDKNFNLSTFRYKKQDICIRNNLKDAVESKRFLEFSKLAGIFIKIDDLEES